MFKRTNYYVRKINGNKINLEEALEMFEIKYKKSLKFKYVSQGTRLDLIDLVENDHYISKSLSIKMLNGKISLEVFDEDEEEDYEYYYYINPNVATALTYYPNYPDLIDNNLHKVPLSMFTEDKEFVCEVIKDFFDKGNTEKIKENYIKNKWIMDKY
ncbi:hypothetical protein [Leptotrichia massiliensis]|uniref:hypothetical protein n=1 Tax=Leptotrichia massiliensis TaxID=1852388 RepID=UPI0028D043B2|nr:hypothetical protein [Leptotrichia massiliensis]